MIQESKAWSQVGDIYHLVCKYTASVLNLITYQCTTFIYIIIPTYDSTDPSGVKWGSVGVEGLGRTDKNKTPKLICENSYSNNTCYKYAHYF